MRLSLLGLVGLLFSISVLSSCAGKVPTAPTIEVVITNIFPNQSIQVGAQPVTLGATVLNDKQGKGVMWSLTVANSPCSPGCGTLVPSIGLSTPSAVYTPPTTAPLNQQATISATSVADSAAQYSFIFTIVPPTTVSITNKFASTIAGAPGIVVNASVSNDT